MPTLLEDIMANSRTRNPYPDLSSAYSDGLDFIIANLPGTPTVDDLVNTVNDYIINHTGWFSSPPASIPVEVSSVAYSAINSYINGQVRTMYHGTQSVFVNDLVGLCFIDHDTVDSVPNNVFNIQQNIPKKGMSVAEQTPLFFATAIGQSGYDYWLNQITTSGSWTTYLGTALTSATANLPFYVAAGMEGALIGARSTPRTMIEPTTAVVSNEIISALIGALTIGAGKVIFKWVPTVENRTFWQTFEDIKGEPITLTSRIDDNNSGNISLMMKNNIAYISSSIIPSEPHHNTTIHNLSEMEPTIFNGIATFDLSTSNGPVWFIPIDGTPPTLLGKTAKDGDDKFCVMCFCRRMFPTFLESRPARCVVKRTTDGEGHDGVTCVEDIGAYCTWCDTVVFLGAGCGPDGRPENIIHLNGKIAKSSFSHNGPGILIKAEKIINVQNSINDKLQLVNI